MKKQLTAKAREREKLISYWIKSWKEKNIEGFKEVFSSDIHYIRSWGPEYHGLLELRYWFTERNERRTILEWNIDRFFHAESETVIHWVLKDKLKNDGIKTIEGVSLIKWNNDNRIAYLQDFICNIHRSDPYRSSESPDYTDQQLKWFDKLSN